MNNCLIDDAIGYIIWHCDCVPSFFDSNIIHDLALPWKIKEKLLCFREKLNCAMDKMKSISIDNITKTFDKELSKEMKEAEKILNISIPKPTGIQCLPACEVQENHNQISFALYPQKDNFFYQDIFCHAASHILQATCKDDNHKFFLDMKQPNLCQTLVDFDEYFGQTSSCENWPHNFLTDKGKPNNTLLKELVDYGENNLAMVKIMIQSPYVTKMKRDVAMAYTTFIANSGGLLGLCLGFSFISGVELIFWTCCCCKEFWKYFPCNMKTEKKKLGMY